MNWQNAKKYLSMLVSAFVGGGVLWAGNALQHGVPITEPQWAAFGMGFVVAGLAAVAHLYQAPPGAIVVKPGVAS